MAETPEPTKFQVIQISEIKSDGLANSLGETGEGDACAQKSDDEPDAFATAAVPEDFKAIEEASTQIRLPKTPEEQAELVRLAEQSLPAAYDWIYGSANPLTQAVQGLTWKDAGFSDPKEGLAQMQRGLNQVQRDDKEEGE